MSDAFPLSGSIDPNAFPFLLMDLHRHEATGSLRVEGPTYQKALYYRAGRILFGSSNDPRDQLGAILIESGKISPEQLDDVNAKVGPGNPLARVLSESGFVNQRELSEAARAKVERIFSDVIAYDAGSFEFEDGVLPRGAIDLKLATDKLTLAAVRRVADRAFVLRFLGSLEVVLGPTEALHERLSDIQDETGGLPEQLDGSRTLKQAAGLARLEEFEAGKVACALLFLGLVEKAAEAAASEAEPDISFSASPALGDEAGFDFGIDDATTEEPAFFVSPEPDAGEGPSAAEPMVEAVSSDEPLVISSDEEAPAFAHDALPEMASEPDPEPAVAAPAPEPTSTQPLPPAAPDPQPPRPEPSFRAPDPPQPTPPSREDLAALDQLLNSRAPEGPMAPLETHPHGEKWEPHFGSGPRTHHPGKRQRSKLPAVLGTLAAVAVLGGAAGWYFFMGPGALVTEQITDPAPVTEAPPPSTAAPADSEGVLEAAEASGQEVDAPDSTTPDAPEPAVTQAAAARPTAAPPRQASDATRSSLVQAREQLRAGEHDAAAAGFASAMRAQPKGVFSIQVLVACAGETITKAVENVSAPELYVLPVNYRGRDCYRVCWGVYASEAAAAGAVSKVPVYFTQGGARPKPAPIDSLLP